MAPTHLIRFNDGSGNLKSKDWLIATGGIYRGEKVVSPRLYDSDIAVTLAPGQGRNGGDAMKITLYNSGALPDFYLIPYNKYSATPGTTVSDPAWWEGYTLPRGKRANRIHIWFKYPSGFRNQSSAVADRNYHIGTYHREPGVINTSGTDSSHESNGWHCYHEIVVRHDLAGTDWVHICLNEHPTHQRGLDVPAINMTKIHGNYWELATRIYFAAHPYGPLANANPSVGDAQIAAPYEVLVDSIYMDYEDEVLPVEIQVENWAKGQIVDTVVGKLSPRWNVWLTNTTNEPCSGHLQIEASLEALLLPKLYVDGTNTNAKETDIVLAPNETRQYQMEVLPSAAQFQEDKSSWFLSVSATGGTYFLSGISENNSFFQTAPIPWNESASGVQLALGAFTSGNGFTVYDYNGLYPYRIVRNQNSNFPAGNLDWTIGTNSTGLVGAKSFAFLSYGAAAALSVIFIPRAEEVNGRDGTEVLSKADPNVRYDTAHKGYEGPPDAAICVFNYDIRPWYINTPDVCRPISNEPGAYWRHSKNTNLSRQISLSNMSGSPYVVRLVDYEYSPFTGLSHTASGGGTLTISSGGLVNYSPTADLEGIVSVRYYLHDIEQMQVSPTYMLWIIVSSTPRAAQSAGKVFMANGRLVTLT